MKCPRRRDFRNSRTEAGGTPKAESVALTAFLAARTSCGRTDVVLEAWPIHDARQQALAKPQLRADACGELRVFGVVLVGVAVPTISGWQRHHRYRRNKPQVGAERFAR